MKLGVIECNAFHQQSEEGEFIVLPSPLPSWKKANWILIIKKGNQKILKFPFSQEQGRAAKIEIRCKLVHALNIFPPELHDLLKPVLGKTVFAWLWML